MTDYIYVKTTRHSELRIEYYTSGDEMILEVDDGNYPSGAVIHLSVADLEDMARAARSFVDRNRGGDAPRLET